MSSLIAAIYAYDRNETCANALLFTLGDAPVAESFNPDGSTVSESLAFVYGLKIGIEVNLTIDESNAFFDFLDANEGRDDLDIQSGDDEYADIRAVVYAEGKVLFVPYVDEDGEPTAKFFSLESAA